MKQQLDQKILILTTKAKEGKLLEPTIIQHISSKLHNSLAEKIITQEKAKSFMALLQAL